MLWLTSLVLFPSQNQPPGTQGVRWGCLRNTLIGWAWLRSPRLEPKAESVRPPKDPGAQWWRRASPRNARGCVPPRSRRGCQRTEAADAP